VNKFQIIKQLRNNGDSIISFKGDKEAILATTDFSARYIKRKKSQRFTILKDSILLFSLTDNSFKNVRVIDIQTIQPLASVLRNPSPEIIIDA